MFCDNLFNITTVTAYNLGEEIRFPAEVFLFSPTRLENTAPYPMVIRGGGLAPGRHSANALRQCKDGYSYTSTPPLPL